MFRISIFHSLSQIHRQWPLVVSLLLFLMVIWSNRISANHYSTHGSKVFWSQARIRSHLLSDTLPIASFVPLWSAQQIALFSKTQTPSPPRPCRPPCRPREATNISNGYMDGSSTAAFMESTIGSSVSRPYATDMPNRVTKQSLVAFATAATNTG